MEIVTKSIKNYLKEVIKKSSNKIGYSDLLKVESITIDGKDENDNKQLVSFGEVKLLKNLRYLEIRNIMITDYIIKILEDMDYLENIIFKNCTFRKTITTMNNLKPLRQIRIENCKNFNLKYIDRIVLNTLNLKDFKISSLRSISKNIEILDISRCIVSTNKNLDKLNIKKLIISHNDYLKYKNDLDKVKYEVVVMADLGYYIELDS